MFAILNVLLNYVLEISVQWEYFQYVVKINIMLIQQQTKLINY